MNFLAILAWPLSAVRRIPITPWIHYFTTVAHSSSPVRICRPSSIRPSSLIHVIGRPRGPSKSPRTHTTPATRNASQARTPLRLYLCQQSLDSRRVGCVHHRAAITSTKYPPQIGNSRAGSRLAVDRSLGMEHTYHLPRPYN